MNRNLNAHYMSVPTADVPRSVVVDTPTHRTTANASYVVPFHMQECIPGSTYSFDTACNLRMSPAVHATMDTAYLDVFYFAVPHRILWDNFKHFIGEPEDFWTPDREYTIPQISFPSGGFSPGSVADHFGLPTLVSNPINHDGSNSVSQLPFRAYCMIWNEFFRDTQTMSPAYVPTGDNDIVGYQLGTSGVENEFALRGAELLKASKPRDLFTSAMPSPQRGPDVPIILGGQAPVTTATTGIVINSGNYSNTAPLVWGTINSNNEASILSGAYDLYAVNNPSAGIQGTDGRSNSTVTITNNLQPLNLVAHLGDATAASVNDLRQAIAIQHIYEALALSGNRYREMLYHIWGVMDTNPMRDVPTYLGGNRVSINQQSIVQTSETDSTPQANVAGYTHVTNRSNSFTFSTLEWCYIIGVFCIRQPKSYQQGINRMWLHKNRFDLFWPQLSSLGSVGIENREIFFGNYSVGSEQDKNTEIFGYNEAWYQYRYMPDTVSGMFRSNYPGGSLDSWHYADYYEECPILSSDFIADNSDVNIERTLAVSSRHADQFLIDITIRRTQTQPLPVYSVPGLERI